MKGRLTLWMILLGCCCLEAGANNVRITDKVKVAGRLGKDTVILSFPLKWDNSWRLDENWDAVYLFIKYKRKEVEEPWRHLCLKNNGHRVDPAYTWSLAQTQDGKIGGKPGPSNVGLFVFRNATGAGTASTMVRLAVDISQGDLQPYYQASYEDFKSGKIEISVAAIEMVFVPRGPYYLGDALSYDTFGDAEGSPVLITGEDSLTLSVKEGTAQTLRQEKVGLRKLYPKGYEGFYCMKYEISQEQYVYFLNKLPYREQKKRIGNNLDELSMGNYAFGDRTYPDGRNGIILEKRRAKGWNGTGSSGDTAVVFGHNLYQDDGIYNGPKDGKTVACNFLTPEDAKTYADWTGLRLMTELEYEKACRMRNPSVAPNGYQYAWNGMTLNIPSGGLATGLEGTVNEIAAGDANANAGGKFNGPMRCGSFAREGTTFMSTTGATYWGALDMTGNLAEMECNAVAGKQMVGIEGDGSLSSEVISWENDTVINWYGSFWVPAYTRKVMVCREWGTDFRDRWNRPIVIRDSFWLQTEVRAEGYSSYYNVYRTITLPKLAWPDILAAYGVRGGSYKDTDRDYLAVSARREYDLFRSGVNDNPALSKSPRLPYVTFRLVRGMPLQVIKAGRIGLQNDEFKDTVVLCDASPYVIRELDAGSVEEAAILYEWEQNDGSGWQKIDGETGKTLTLTNHWNTDSQLKSREYRRKSVTPLGEGYSNSVTLTLIGIPEFQPLQGVIGDCNRTVPIAGSISVKADSMLWYRADNNAFLGIKDLNVEKSIYTPTRTEFPVAGSYQIVCKAYVGVCPVVGTANINVEPPLGAADCPSVVTDKDGNEYRAAILADCRCWMLEPLNFKTLDSKTSPDGIEMYNWADVANEPSSYNKEGMTSYLCPEGFFIPTQAEVTNLTEHMNGVPATEEIKGPKPYGYLSEHMDPVQNGYYWAVIYSDYLENQGYYQTQCSVMTINAAGMIELITEIPDADGFMLPSTGDMYFPVRCIKEKQTN